MLTFLDECASFKNPCEINYQVQGLHLNAKFICLKGSKVAVKFHSSDRTYRRDASRSAYVSFTWYVFLFFKIHSGWIRWGQMLISCNILLHNNPGSHIYTWKLPTTTTLLSTEQPCWSKLGLSALLKGNSAVVFPPQSNLPCLSEDWPGDLPVKSSLL